MNLLYLSYFLEIAQKEHLTKAAEELHITQPALSRALANLEQELGVKLFERDRKKMRLNENGRILKKSAERIFAELESLRQQLSDTKDTVSGRLCIGSSFPERDPDFIQECILEFMQLYPDVAINYVQTSPLQLLRSLSNTPLQVDIVFLAVKNHVSKNTSANHLNRFYENFENVKDQKFDGFIITGAPVEQMPFEEVDYWEETCKILDWAETHVTSTLHICWAAQAGFYHYYGINKRQLPQKLFGVYEHKVSNRKIPLVRGFDDIFLAPHSRHTETPSEAIHA